MQITVTGGEIGGQPADAYVVSIAEGARRLAGQAAALDRALDGALTAQLTAGIAKGKNGEISIVATGGRLPARAVVLLGTGKRDEAETADRLRTRMANAARRLRTLDVGLVAIGSGEATAALDPEEAGRAIAEGLLLGLYRFDRHHTKAADRASGSVGDVTLVEPVARKVALLTDGVGVGQILAEAQNLTRDLANEPANLMTPTILAARAQRLASERGLECKVIERAEAERLKMGAYLSVANGSVQPPKFIVLTYRGGRGNRFIGLIGKGITFDSGGISLKPGAGMESMKGDMTGAAAVLGAMDAIARLKPAVNVMAIAPCTENMPSGSATKPGDVVYAMDGQSIEVVNTDAEGRLVLADALAYARNEGCTTLIDIATLTGAMSVALGSVRYGVFANDDRVARDLERAADAAGERLWRMPLDGDYEEQIKSDVADIKNTGGRPAGSITAAKFIQHFAGDTPWAHLDIAGVMTASSDKGVLVKGNSGMPVRTLVHFVLARAR
ncbi:MAG: leucyl aminopeptidase [Dehalococcoidia bacterium]